MSRITEKQQVRAACYCRISSDPNDKREGVTRQREDTAALCEVKGWQVAGVYVDNDRSASSGKKRPEWDRLLADIEAGKIDAVAAWDQDRVNRMMEDFVAYKKVFVKQGVLLATSNNGDIDLSTPSGVLTATIKTAVSEHEVDMMRVRQRRAGRQRAERGTPKWKCAFGFTDDHQPDPVEAPMVRKAYETILGGGSLSGLAREWNAAGCYGRRWQKADPGVPGDVGRSVLSKPWSASTLSLFLRSPRNAGLRAYDGKIIGVGTWPPWSTRTRGGPRRLCSTIRPGSRDPRRAAAICSPACCAAGSAAGRCAGTCTPRRHRSTPAGSASAAPSSRLRPMI